MPEKSGGNSFKWIVAAVVCAAVVGGYLYFRHRHAEPLGFNTAAVSRGGLTQTVTATGTLNPVKSVLVGCQVSGRISTLYVDFNSAVTNGQLIAEIDPRIYDAQVEQAEADLANATANLELQSVQSQRTAELYTNKLVSGSDYDTALATLHQAEAVVKIKRAALDNSRANRNYTKIVSPVDGVVISRSVDVGQTVAASFNTPTLFQIANDLTKMQIDAAVAEADVGGVVEEQAVDFTVDAYPTRTFHGVVTQVRRHRGATGQRAAAAEQRAAVPSAGQRGGADERTREPAANDQHSRRRKRQGQGQSQHPHGLRGVGKKFFRAQACAGADGHHRRHLHRSRGRPQGRRQGRLQRGQQ
jgi:RND family efflux transporter MFP subunit